MMVAGCGAAGETITVVDGLTGQPDGCRWAPKGYFESGGNFQACTGFIFNRQCGSYLGTIQIVYQPVTDGITPNTVEYLNTLGIGNINYIGGNFFIDAANATGTLSPSVFGNLQFVGQTLLIQNCAALVHIGGLEKLQQVTLHPIM